MSDEEDSAQKGKKTFWETLPGILTGIAALIVAVTGCAALIVNSPTLLERFLSAFATPTPTAASTDFFSPEWYFGGARDSDGEDTEQGTHGVGPGDCPSGQAVVGIQYFDGTSADPDAVDGVAIHCSDGTWYTSDAPSLEQGRGDVGLGDCASGHVVGVQYFDGAGGNRDAVDGIGMLCSDGTPYNWYTGGARDSDGEDTEQGTHGVGPGNCPSGQAVVGIQYFDGTSADPDAVDGVAMHCSDETLLSGLSLPR
jgi:hypothetical protein